MKVYYFIFLIAALSFTTPNAQTEESAVAKVGKDKITEKDFKLRVELSPYIPTNQKVNRRSDTEFKRDFLYSLIAEKLWALEAEDLGYASTKKFHFFFKPIEDLFVRDALFKKEIENKIKLSPSDVNTAINRSQFKLQAKIVSSEDSIQIFSFFNNLNNSSNFDSLFSIYNALDSASAEIDIGSLKDEAIEDTVYSLKIHEISHPLKTENRWVIFKMNNKVFTPIDLNDQAQVNKSKNAVRDRRIENYFNQYRSELLRGKKIKIDPKAFLFVGNIIWKYLKSKPSNDDSLSQFALSEWDFISIINSSSDDELNQRLFSIEDYHLAALDFLGDLAFNGFNVNELDSLLVLNKLNQRVKLFVENQIITHEGLKLSLKFDPEVVRDLKLWKQKYLAEIYFKSTFDSISVTDNEIFSLYIKEFIEDKNIPLINLRMITLDNLDEVAEIFDLIKDGQKFENIVRTYGDTDPLVNEIGESGLKPVVLLGDVGNIASSLKLNEVYGPIRRGDLYSIIQVIEKKEKNDSVKFAFETIKNELRNVLRLRKLSESLNQTTSKLAEKYEIKIYNEALEKIKFTNIPMFIHRLMGFGGRIAGMPLLTPFSEWMDDQFLNKVLLP